MNKCPITYLPCGDQMYSPEGLKLLSRKLTKLNEFPFTAKEQIQLAAKTTKLSIQGYQPKLSVVLNTAKEEFEIVEAKGNFIFKPQNLLYGELPQNEDVTMKCAKIVGIETPLHGMVYSSDHTLTYFIKRFDRYGKNSKLATEDFAQLLDSSRDTKYDGSMEKVAGIVETYCTFPILEKIKLFRLVLFSFLIGNEDLHLKNFSLIRKDDQVSLTPAYDLLNTTIVVSEDEELALPIRGKKSSFKKADFFDYYGKERLKLHQEILDKELKRFEAAIPLWKELLLNSFLSEEMRFKYLELIEKRWKRICDS